jgi:hypothetical protein
VEVRLEELVEAMREAADEGVWPYWTWPRPGYSLRPRSIRLKPK